MSENLPDIVTKYMKGVDTMKKLQKILSAILACAVGTSVLSAGLPAASAASEGTYEIVHGTLHYEIRDDGTAVITDFDQTTNYDWWVTIEVPEEVEGAAVTAIASDAFSSGHGLIGLTLPASVVSVGENAFANTYSFTVHYGGSQAQWESMDVAAGNDSLLDATIEYTIDGFNYYILNDGTASLSGYDSASGEVILPDTLEGLTVTEIYGSAFRENNEMTSVMIPDGVTKINSLAFYGCSELSHIDFPESITEICSNAFNSCTSLTEVVLPENLVTLSTASFGGCSALEQIVLPESIETVGDEAFNGCTALTDVTLPDKVISYGNKVFPTVWLNKHRQENGMAIFNNIVFDGTGCTGDIVIPDGTVYIASSAFRASGITSVTIPGSVQSVGINAFIECESLASAVLEEGMTSVGPYMFSDCTNLADVSLPDTITSIGKGSFKNCTAILAITLPDELTVLGNRAFGGCYRITEMVIPDGVKSIGAYAFTECRRLKTVVLPEGLTEIQESAFDGCDRLSEINMPEGVNSVGKYAFRDTAWLRHGIADDPFFSINGIFIDGRTLSGVLTFPDTVHTINTHAFSPNSDAVRINLSDSVTTIGNYAFYSCHALEDIYIPKSVTTIDYWAFHMSSVSTIYYEGTEEDWAAIQLDDSNAQALEDITIIYSASLDTVPSSVPGDIDGNSAVSLDDAAASISHYAMTAAGLTGGLTAEQLAAADINGDSMVNLDDAACILAYYAQTAAGLAPAWDDIIGA